MKIKLTNMLRGKEKKKEGIDMQSWIEVDKEDLYILKTNSKGTRTVGKANNRINAEKIIIGLKNFKLKFKTRKKKKKKKRGKLHRTSKAQSRGRDLWQQ